MSCNTCHWSFFLERILQRKFQGCRSSRDTAVHMKHNREMPLRREVTYLFLSLYSFYMFVCICNMADAQKGIYSLEKHRSWHTDRQQCELVQGKATSSCFSDSFQFCKPTLSYAPSQAKDLSRFLAFIVLWSVSSSVILYTQIFFCDQNWLNLSFFFSFVILHIIMLPSSFSIVCHNWTVLKCPTTSRKSHYSFLCLWVFFWKNEWKWSACYTKLAHMQRDKIQLQWKLFFPMI